MKRLLCAATAALVMLPCAGEAQNPTLLDRPVWGPRIQVTPIIGFAAAATRHERWLFKGPGGSATDEFSVNLASGPVAGMAVEVRLVDRLALIGSGLYVSRGRTVERSQATDAMFRHEGSNFLFTKAAVALRLRESISELQVHSLTGTIFIGPAWVREMPKADPNSPAVFLEGQNYWGGTAGLDVIVPLAWDGLTLQAGIEDYYVRWNDAELARRNDVVVAGITSAVETDPTHTVIFRAGLSIRMR
jgi:hypothetical protein